MLLSYCPHRPHPSPPFDSSFPEADFFFLNLTLFVPIEMRFAGVIRLSLYSDLAFLEFILFYDEFESHYIRRR